MSFVAHGGRYLVARWHGADPVPDSFDPGPVQPDLFEYWSLGSHVEGWSYYFAEVSVTGFAMLTGLRC